MRVSVRDQLVRMREPERGLPVFLMILVLSVFVLPSLGIEGEDGRLYGEIVSSLLVISGVAVAAGERRLFLLTSVVAAAGLILRWASWFSPPGTFGAWPDLTTIATILLFCYVILTQVISPGPVTVARVQGAVAVYLMLGIAWASAYAVAEHFYPGSFTSTIGKPETVNDWIYFSFVTLTTVGYGDVVPVHRVARALAIGEALSGQLYIAVLLARLVSLEVSGSKARED
jgi:voltage-gated potassium channel Kch